MPATRRARALVDLADADILINMGARIEAHGRPIWSILRADILYLLTSACEAGAADVDVHQRADELRRRLALWDPASRRIEAHAQGA